MARKQRSEGTGGEGATGRLTQIRSAYRMTRQADRWIGWIMAAVAVPVFAIALGIGFLLGQPILVGVPGFVLAVLTAMIVFSRRAEKAAYAQVEGQPGAAASVLNAIRRGWTITPAVAASRNQDVVHRAVGRAGVVLVAEGAPTRVTNLLTAEKRRTARFVADVPIHEVVIGDDEGEVPLRKLQRHLMKLPRQLKPAEVTEINMRLRAVGDLTKNVPIPKGPPPKGARLPRGGGMPPGKGR